MSEETAVAAPSAAVERTPSFEIPRSGTAEYAEWRMSGELPEKPKPEASAPSDAEKDQATDDGGAEPPKKQERRKPDAEARIKQLTDDLKRVRQELDEVRKPTPKAESSPAKSAPQTYQEWRKTFVASKWIENYSKENPQSSYEDATAAMADYLGDVRDQYRAATQQRETMDRQVKDRVADARERYGADLDKVLFPTVEKIRGKVAPAVEAMLNESELLPHVLFTMGSDADGLNSFLQASPGKQLRYIAAVESGIQAELSKESAPNRNETGQFTAKPPAKRGPESAPEPPLEIGNRGAITLNESDRALQAIQKGDAKATRAWLHAENAKDLARRRGA